MNARMQQMLADYSNGNLKDAKRRAKGISQTAIREELIECGWDADAATAIAAYLKGEGTWQAACDAEAKAKDRA